MQKINALTIPTDGLVAWYPLDGTANAKVGTDGTATNITWVTSEKGYTSEQGDFDGNSSKVDIPDITVNDNFTICTVITTTTTVVGFAISSRTTGVNDRIYIGTLSGGDLNIAGGATFVSGLSGYNDRKPHTIIFSKNGSQYNCYIDGEEVASFTDSNTITTLNNLGIGYLREGNVQYFPGNIGETIFYDRALEEYERTAINQYYNREMGPINSPKSITASHIFPSYSTSKLNEGKIMEYSRPAVSGTYYDQTGNGNSSTTVSGVTDSTVGNYNVMSFNGSSSYIGISNHPLTGDKITVCFRVTINSSSSLMQIMGEAGTYSINRILTSDGKISCQYSNNYQSGVTNVKSTALADGDYNVCMVRDGSYIEIYIDGILNASGTTGSAYTSVQSFNFGKNASNVWYYNGKLINPILYDRTLTAEEVQEYHIAHFIPND